MTELEQEGRGWTSNLLGATGILAALLLLAGCGADPKVGDYVIHDPGKEENGGAGQDASKSSQKAGSELGQGQAEQEAKPESVGEAK